MHLGDEERRFSEDIRKEALFCLIDAEDCRLQRCEIKKKIETRLTNKNYLPSAYGKKKLDGNLNTTLSRVLVRLCMKDKLVESDPKGHMESFYFIPKGKQAVARETLAFELKKQEHMPHLEDLLEFATNEELQELTRAYLTFPQWDFISCFEIEDRYFKPGENLPLLQNKEINEGSYYSKFNGKIFQLHVTQLEMPYTIRHRKLIKDFKTAGAPQAIVKIGEDMIKGQNVHPLDQAIFYYYPADASSAVNWLKQFPREREKQATVLLMIAERDQKIAELYRQKYLRIWAEASKEVPS